MKLPVAKGRNAPDLLVITVDNKPRRRARYETPRLKEFGHIGTLTQSGTGTTQENKPGKGSKKKFP